MFETLIANKPQFTGTQPAFSTELVGPASWRLSFAGTALANKGENVARKEPITFNARDTIEMADRVNTTGNFAS